MTGRLLAAVPTADPPSYNTVSPGIAGFLVVFVLALATIVLIRSMVGHLRKVRYSQDPASEDAAPEAPGHAQAEGSGDAPPPAPATEVPPVSGEPGRRPPR
jgi:hypothetical protein